MSIFRIFLLCCLMLSLTASAQDIHVSETEKVTSNFLSYRVIGKNSAGVLVYKHKRDRETIELFDANMGLVRRKTLPVGELNAETVKVELMEDDLIHFYSFKVKRMQYLAAQRINSKLEDVGPQVLLDSFDRRADENWTTHYITRAEGGTNVMAYRVRTRTGDLLAVQSQVFDPKLKAVWEGEVAFDEPDRSMTLTEAFLSQSGCISYVLLRDEGRLRADSYPHIVVHSKSPGGGFSRSELASEVPKRRIREVKFAWDLAGDRMVAAGFFSDDNRPFAKGTFLAAHDPVIAQFTHSTFQDFQEGFVKSLTGKTSRKREEIPIYEIQDLVIRSDGGAMVSAEYVNESAEAYEYTDYDPYYGGYRTSTRYINYHEYEDIILFNMEPDGTVTWDDVIRKKQVSREDYGKNSSYCLINARRKLFFIFNEEISYDTNVMQYSLEAGGELDRSALFNANANEVMLVPRKAKQVAGNEIVIPSVYKNSLSFVKLTF